MTVHQAEKEGTVESLALWTVVGRPAEVRRTFAGGARVVSGAEKEIICSRAPFGRLDQMQRTTRRRRKKKKIDRGGPVWPPRSNAKDVRLGAFWGGKTHLSKKTGGSGGAAPQQPPSQNVFVCKNSF